MVFLFQSRVLIPPSIEVLVGVISVGRSLKIVCSRLRDGVDCTACKSALTDVERRSHHLYLLNGIQCDGVGVGLVAVCTTARQAEHVVAHHTVYLKRVVAVVRSRNGDTTFLVGLHQRR